MMKNNIKLVTVGFICIVLMGCSSTSKEEMETELAEFNFRQDYLYYEIYSFEVNAPFVTSRVNI
jgi:hypothetical protein